MRKGLLARTIALVISAGMLATSMPEIVYALEDSNATTSEEYLAEENVVDNSVAISDEVSCGLLSFDAYDAQNKVALQSDVASLEKASAGVDYSDNELIYLCNSLEEAEEAAKLYTQELGVDITVKDYLFGVAKLKIGKPIVTNGIVSALADSDELVKDIVAYAADMDTIVPAVYPNGYAQIESIEADTSLEYFSDPNTKWNLEGGYNTKFQWSHELIGSKYVWEAMDNGTLQSTSDKYDSFKEALADTVVAIVDTGLFIGGKDFTDANGDSVYVGRYSFVGSDPSDVTDNNGHGTHVAGIIADAVNDYQGRGVAAGVKVMPLRVSESNTMDTSDILRALNYATASRKKYEGIDVGSDYDVVPAYNVQVINMSLGSYIYESSYLPVLDEVNRTGITVCSSAGNNGNRVLHYPSSYPHVICVASVNSELEKSYFSCYGPDVDIATPGGERRTSYRYDEYFYNISGSKYIVSEDIYASGNTATEPLAGKYGTSMASPVGAAVAALVKAKYPDMSPEDVEELLESTATPCVSDEIGAGCINAARALGIDDAPNIPEVKSALWVDNNINITLGNDDEYSSIYYTINGPDPDVSNIDATDTKRYNLEEPIVIDYETYGKDNGTGVLKVIAYKYSRASEVNTYTFEFANEEDNRIEISSTTGVSEVTVGKKLSMSATFLPESSYTTDIRWESLNTEIATISDKGVVSALSEGTVSIRAVGADGTVSNTYVITVMPKVTNIEIDLPSSTTRMYNSNTILLKPSTDGTATTESTYDLSIVRVVDDMTVGTVSVWPKTALQKVAYSSSNPKVVMVDEDGIVKAVGSGNATVTVIAADGSGIKDTQKFRVETPVYSINMFDKNDSISSCKIVEGDKFTPQVKFNDGLSTPDNKKLKWSIVSAKDRNGESVFVEDAATINTSTGVIVANISTNITAPVTLQIRAESIDGGVSDELTLKAYRKTSKLGLNTSGVDYYGGHFELQRNTIVSLFSLLNMVPTKGETKELMGLVSVSSSDSGIVYVDAQEGLASVIRVCPFNVGKAVLTVRTLDGTNKSVKIPITVYSNETFSAVGIICTEGDNIYYPGKKLKYKVEANKLITLDSSDFAFIDKINGNWVTVDNPYIVVNSKGEVAKKPRGEVPTEHSIAYILGAGYKDNVRYNAYTGIDIYPSAVKSIVINSIDKSEGEGTVDFAGSTVTFSHAGDKAIINATSLPENAYQGEYTYSSSNENIVKVSKNGTIEAIKNGTAKVYVVAGDGSKTKATITVKIDQTKATNVMLDKNLVQLSTVEVGGIPSTCVLSVNSIEPISACPNTIATTSNKKVATVAMAKKSNPNEMDSYIINAVGKGKATIKVMADDGSKKYATCTVVVTEPVTSISLKSSTRSYILKPTKSLTLKATTNKASNKKVSYDFYANSAEERAQMEKYVTLDGAKGVVKAKPAQTEYDIEHEVYIYAKADDYGGYASQPICIVVSPAKVLMKNLKVKSKTDMYDLSAGKSLQMLATTNTDATNKKIDWELVNCDSYGTSNDSAQVNATISSSGSLKAKSTIESICYVLVKASAKDGSGVTATRMVTLYPATKEIEIDSSELISGSESRTLSGVHTVNVGDKLVLSVNGMSASGSTEGDTAPCQKFYITYSNNGVGKAYLNNSDGTSVVVKTIAKGNITINAMALDGSGKKTSYSIKVQ